MKTATTGHLALAALRNTAQISLVLWIISIAAATRPCLAATGGGLSDYVVFGGHQVTFSSSINVFNAPLALVGSNGDISFDSATVRGTQFQAGGSLVGNPSFLTANNLVFNGNVQFGGLTNISGNVDAGGTANIGATVGGNVTANGGVTVGGTVNGNVATNNSLTLPTFGQVSGNVQAAQDVTMQPSTTIQGNVTYGGNLLRSGTTTIGGTITHAASSTSPLSFSPLGIPASSFSAGGPDISIPVFGTAAPAPGSYGAVSIDRGTLELSPGKYFFNSVTATSGFMNLNLRLDQPGDIELYVLGDYNVPLQVTEVNGVAISAADAALASRVFVESHGNVFVGWDNLGTLYAPAGDVTLDSLTDLWGQVIAGHDAIFGGGADVQFVPSAHLPTAVAEPETIYLLALGMALVVGTGFGRRSRMLQSVGG
jgi:cytoskeletal protein CcmA (bactofilin family)